MKLQISLDRYNKCKDLRRENIYDWLSKNSCGSVVLV